jgi:hypothetical protein
MINDSGEDEGRGDSAHDETMLEVMTRRACGVGDDEDEDRR